MIYEKLNHIQTALKAPKGQYNSFGKYSYRSAEDILEALKPLLAETKTVINLSDEMVQGGGRVYVKATAKIYDCEDTTHSVCSVSFAREPDSKKGMDSSQITGSASSYARKYALCGLLALDDNKDADTWDNRNEGTPKARTGKPNPTVDPEVEKAAKKMMSVAKQHGWTNDDVKALVENMGFRTWKEMSVEDINKATGDIKNSGE